MAAPAGDDPTRIEMPTPTPAGTEPRRRVLLISYRFPPEGGGGVQRVCKMARYLPARGWIPHVLTVKREIDPMTVDDGLLRQLPGVTHIHRAPESSLRHLFSGARAAAGPGGQTGAGPSPARRAARAVLGGLRDHLLVPDEQIIWRRGAVREAVRVVRRHRIDALFSSHGPATNHLVARELASRTGLPWVADFRDPWAENLHFDSLPAHRRRRERRLERRVVQGADAVTTVTGAFAADFLRRYEARICPRIYLIYNGFDPDDYRDPSPAQREGDRFTCVYAGALYPKRSPAPILHAVRRLIDRGDIDPAQIRLVFAGIFDYPGRTENRDLVRALELDEVVQVVGQLPHAEAISHMWAADALLLVGDSHPRAGDYIPGKVYEYLALGRPVIGTLQAGEAQELLNRHTAAYLAPPADVEGVAESFLTLFCNWRNETGPFAPDRVPPDIPSHFHRDYQAGQLAAVLNGIAPR